MSALPDRFFDVGGGVFRSAQPTTAEQWATLRDAYGVARVLKLNFAVEGDDDLATEAGLQVISAPIEPEGDVDFVTEVEGIFAQPSDDDVRDILRALATADASPVLVHCTHGEDRTGFAIAMLRVVRDGWPKERAWHEMIAHGFHPELIGLVMAWERFEAPSR